MDGERDHPVKTLLIEYNPEQRPLSTEELLKGREELSILLEATAALVSQLDIENILAILGERIGETVSCTFVKILLMTEDGSKHVVKAAYPVHSMEWDPALGHTVEVKPDSPVFPVISDRVPLLMHSEELMKLNADHDLKRCLLGDLDAIQSLLIMPVTMHGEYFGLVVLGERRHWDRSPFTVEKSSLAMALVQYAGIAIKNAFHVRSLHQAHVQTIIGLAEALETRDSYTRGHSDRAIENARTMARELRFTPEQAERLQYAVILHDIGKIGIPDSILNKPGALTNEEYELMKTHAVKGASIVSKIRFLEQIAPLIRHHHERWDGTGYPDGLAGTAIPIESRIVAVLDSYDAMTSDRIYRKAPGRNYAMTELRRYAGTQYDPEIVEAFLKILNP